MGQAIFQQVILHVAVGGTDDFVLCHPIQRVLAVLLGRGSK